MGPDPFIEFASWFSEARAAGVPEPEAMSLATCSPAGDPSVRVVLFRGLSEGGLQFFTNYQSRKGGELLSNPRAALMFYWHATGKQVRFEGPVAPVTAGESDAYFASRPRSHQLGAWASEQSRPMTHAEVVARYAALEETYAGRPVPRPPHWGGFRLTPQRIEFWSRRESRLHERTVFERLGNGAWSATELAP